MLAAFVNVPANVGYPLLALLVGAESAGAACDRCSPDVEPRSAGNASSRAATSSSSATAALPSSSDAGFPGCE